MPPPIPLSGAGARSSAGSQPPSARRPANAGRIASVVCSGGSARAISSRTEATNSRTRGVSRTYSSATLWIVSGDQHHSALDTSFLEKPVRLGCLLERQRPPGGRHEAAGRKEPENLRGGAPQRRAVEPLGRVAGQRDPADERPRR